MSEEFGVWLEKPLEKLQYGAGQARTRNWARPQGIWTFLENSIECTLEVPGIRCLLAIRKPGFQLPVEIHGYLKAWLQAPELVA